MAGPNIWKVNASQLDLVLIDEAAAIVRAGGLVAFPTETVYGLAADAGNPNAIARLNEVKGRPPEKPYSVHLADPSQVAEFVSDVPDAAHRLMAAFWPGPLTIVMPAKDGRTTVGFRLPNHPVALAFLRACRCTVVAPSANRSGFPPPTDAPEAIVALGPLFDAILDAGPTPVGRESTVVSVAGGAVTVLREGAIAASAVRDAVQ